MPGGSQSIVTLTTDFGLEDFYVGTMKGAILRHCPGVTIVDITHAVPRHDILFGSIMLERAVAGFPGAAVHLAVVDPGVGGDRRMLVARWPAIDQTAICPDNGLLTWASRRLGTPELWELTWRPATSSNVFHGRDIMGPAAAMLAAGDSIDRLARPCTGPLLLDVRPCNDLRGGGVVLHIDRFGNATTNVPETLMTGVQSVTVAGRAIPVHRTYGDVAPHQPLALVGSSGLLEIAVREGSAAGELGIMVGDSVGLEAETNEK